MANLRVGRRWDKVIAPAGAINPDAHPKRRPTKMESAPAVALSIHVPTRTREEVAAIAGVGRSSVDRALTVLRSGDQELIQKVERGEDHSTPESRSIPGSIYPRVRARSPREPVRGRDQAISRSLDRQAKQSQDRFAPSPVRHRPESRSQDRLISQPDAAKIVGVSVPTIVRALARTRGRLAATRQGNRGSGVGRQPHRSLLIREPRAERREWRLPV